MANNLRAIFFPSRVLLVCIVFRHFEYYLRFYFFFFFRVLGTIIFTQAVCILQPVLNLEVCEKKCNLVGLVNCIIDIISVDAKRTNLSVVVCCNIMTLSFCFFSNKEFK